MLAGLTPLLALLVALQAIVPGALGAARFSERLELAALGLLGAPDCRADAHRMVRAHLPQLPGQQPHDHGDECCLTICTGASPALPPARVATSSLQFTADVNVGPPTLEIERLRSHLTERTGSPRSPPHSA